MVEPGSIIGDVYGDTFRVIEVTEEGLFMVKLPEREDLFHSRTISWGDYEKHGYELKFP